MAIKKLQNNFTTPEQSKRLLELGVPADSANCYLTRFGIDEDWEVKVLNNVKYSEIAICNQEYCLPCWSVGRLIEIFSKCYTGAKCYYSPRNLYKTEFWIERFNRLSKIGFIDFSKLELMSMIDRRPKWEKNLLSDKFYCHFNEEEIDIKECETCGARDCCENNLEKLED